LNGLNPLLHEPSEPTRYENKPRRRRLPRRFLATSSLAFGALIAA